MYDTTIKKIQQTKTYRSNDYIISKDEKMSNSQNSLIEISSAEILTEGLGEECRKAVLLFGAEWHEATPVLKMVLTALAAQTNDENNKIVFGNINADNNSELCEQYDVTMVPTVILLFDGTVWERLEGEVLSDPSHVTLAVQRLTQATKTVDSSIESSSSSSSTPALLAASKEENNGTDHDHDHDHNPKHALNERIERLIRGDTVMLFMKGTPSLPKCGFSRQAVELLNESQVPFGSFDILSDEQVRQGLKVYSDWPTFPQIVRL